MQGLSEKKWRPECVLRSSVWSGSESIDSSLCSRCLRFNAITCLAIASIILCQRRSITSIYVSRNPIILLSFYEFLKLQFVSEHRIRRPLLARTQRWVRESIISFFRLKVCFQINKLVLIGADLPLAPRYCRWLCILCIIHIELSVECVVHLIHPKTVAIIELHSAKPNTPIL